MKVAFLFKRPTLLELKEIKTTRFDGIITGYQNIDQSLINDCLKSKLFIWMEIGCFVGEDLWRIYPNSRPVVKKKPINRLGPPENRWYAGVIPTKEVILNRIKLISSKIKSLSEIEAIYLDFCRFPGRWEDGEGQFILADNTENDLTERQKLISNFILSIKEVTIKNDLKLGIFLTPYDNNYYGQDLNFISKACDFLSPMLYFKICYQSVSWIRNRIDYFYHKTNKKILPVLQSLPEPELISTDDFITSLTMINQKNTQGYMILSWEYLTQDLKKAIM